MKEGWMCPRCKRVNSQLTMWCDCKEENKINFNNRNVCQHYWELYAVDTSGSHYRCKLCGKKKTEIYDPDYNGVTVSN